MVDAGKMYVRNGVEGVGGGERATEEHRCTHVKRNRRELRRAKYFARRILTFRTTRIIVLFGAFSVVLLRVGIISGTFRASGF